MISSALHLEHGCPTFWFAWATLREEELSWAVHKIGNVVNVHK